jgi:hypothetical protein
MLIPINDKLLVRISQENHKFLLEYCLIAARVISGFHRGRTMKALTKKSVVILALTSSFFIGNTSISFADVTPNPNKVAYDAQVALHKVAMEKFKGDMNSFRESMKARIDSRKSINETFKTAVDKAIADFKAAIAIATTAEAKSAAVASRKSAIAAASAVRDTAVIALGALPVKPVEPVKPTRPEKMAREPKAPRPSATATPSA